MESTPSQRIAILNVCPHLPIPPIDVYLAFSLTAFIGLLDNQEDFSVAAQKVAITSFSISLVSGFLDRFSFRRVKKLDFRETFGADIKALPEMPLEARLSETASLVERLNDGYSAPSKNLRSLARDVNTELTRFIAEHTGQYIVTSDCIRLAGLTWFFAPYSSGLCSLLDGEVYIFGDSGVFNPAVLGHELAHRKGYKRELEAQVLAYKALGQSSDAAFRQSAFAERLYRQLNVLKKTPNSNWLDYFFGLRQELQPDFYWRIFGWEGLIPKIIKGITYPFHRAQMLFTRQKEADYDKSFTNFLYASGDRIDT